MFAPIPVQAVDSAGAGDGYMAAVISRLLKGESLAEACRYAGIYAAYSVTKQDCLPGYPTQRQLDEFLQNNTRSGR
jgi:sugar/nucleoside kinase (ribokinase family)